MSDWIDAMGRDWDARAREDAKYYVNCQGRNQDEASFYQSAPDVLHRIRRDYEHLLATPPGERSFLEIGCGLGRLMYSLAADCGNIHGFDISPAMIEGARKALANIPHAHFHVATKNDFFPISDASIDLVYTFAVFQHMPDKSLILRYMDDALRVLKPGGIFVGQFNGAERHEGPVDTWAGEWFSEQELLSYFDGKGWAALSCEGQNSQYMWFTLRKPIAAESLPEDSLPARPVAIFDVKHPWGGRELKAGGLAGYAEVFVRDLPNCFADVKHLSATLAAPLAATLAGTLAGQRIATSFIGRQREDNSRQVNIRIPEGVPTGAHQLTLSWKSRTISNSFEVTLVPNPETALPAAEIPPK